MTIQFFIFTVHISKRTKQHYTESIEKYESMEEKWFDRKMHYLSQVH